MLWAELCPKPHLLKPRPCRPQKVTVFGDGVFTEVIKEKESALTQSD